MRSPENNQSNEEFVSGLKDFVLECNEQQLSYAELKQRVRKYSVDNAKTDEERDLMVRGGYMYFFRYIIDHPEVIENVWRLLYAFQEEINEQDNDPDGNIELTTNLEGLFNENTIGITINWRLVHAILKGELEIAKDNFKGDEIFYTTEPDPALAAEKRRSKKRIQLSQTFQNFLRELTKRSAHGQRLIEKPVPGVSNHPGITSNDLKVLRKIYVYLQNDADMIYYSATWRPQIDYFFDIVIRKKIEEILNKLTFKGNEKSTKFIPFLKEVIDSYLGPLKQYCKDLAEQNQTAGNQINQVPADMMLEPILIANSYLTDDFKVAPIELVLAKWEVLWEEIEALIGSQKSGTLWRIDAFSLPKQQDVALDETIQADAFDDPAVNNKELGKTLAFMPRLTNEIDQAMLEVVRGPEGEKIAAKATETQAREAAQLAVLTADKVREASQKEPRILWENLQVDINSTAGMEALTEEAAAFYQTKPGSEPLENIGAEPKTDYSELKVSSRAELRIKASCLMGEIRNFYSPMAVEELKQKLEAEILPALETAELKKEFMLILLEKLSASRAKFEKEQLINAHIFKDFEDLIREILNRLIIRSGFDADLFIPDQAFIDIVIDKIPNADGYPELVELLRDKGDYQYFVNIENRLKAILNENIQQLQIHRDMQTELKGQPYEANRLKDYYKILKKTVLGLKKEIKRIKGNWAARPFIALGRAISGKGKANKQANEYCDKLEEAIDIIWEDGIIPTFNNFTALYFGTRNG